MLHVVGVGICRGQITRRAAEIIRRADVIFGSRRAFGLAEELVRGEKVIISSFTADVYREIERLSERKEVVVLSTGDPMVSGLGTKFRECHVEPGISSVQEALARLRRDLCEVAVVDAHGRRLGEEDLELLKHRHLLILADKNFDLRLLRGRRVVILENLCGEERIRKGNAETLEVRSDYTIIFVERADF